MVRRKATLLQYLRMTQVLNESASDLPPGKRYIPRLNMLFRFAYIDPWKLTNGDREKLLDNLFFALYDVPRDRQNPLPEFRQGATPEGLAKAQRALREHLECQEPRHRFELPDLGLILFNDPTRGDFFYRFSSSNLTTMVAVELAHLLWMSEITPADILRCSHCQTPLVPRRKPRQGDPTYCSRECANVIAARNYRARNRKVKAKKRTARRATVKKQK